MKETLPVNFHCHSNFSDGELSPEALAGRLAAAGVRYASLTDHDSLEGLPRFQKALRKHGIAFLPGLELTTWLEGREIHLLAYGFDPHHPELIATLQSLRQARDLEVHSIASSLRKAGASPPGRPADKPAASAAPNGHLETGEAIALLHRAGGRAFWAHPLSMGEELETVNVRLSHLVKKSLDGLEAIYEPYPEAERQALRHLARKHGLMICAGTDYHAVSGVGGHSFSIEMGREDWNAFREAVTSTPAFTSPRRDEAGSTAVERFPRLSPEGKIHRFRRRPFILRIFLPTLSAIVLFLAATWGIILPSFESSLLDQKRETIHELTNSAWSILASYYRDEQSGLITREEAQALAVARIEALRYGPEGKDYFWIQDLQPRMIMHPYRPDLNGQDVSNLTDPLGAPIFVEFANLVRQDGEGYIDYVWQWKDDPSRLEPKQSYIKGFEPWGWVIGTGIYTGDVQEEISRIERNIIIVSLVISGAVVILLVFVLEQSLRIERERQEVLDDLRESTTHYHSLVEATTEGTLLILEGHCRYANPTFLEMTGYNVRQLEFLELADLLPPMMSNQEAWNRIGSQEAGHLPGEQACEAILRHADGHEVECVLLINPILFAEQRGFILLVRDVTPPAALLEEGNISRAAQSAPVGIFRARAARRCPLVEMNPAMRRFFEPGTDKPSLADLFTDPDEFETLFQALQKDGEVNGHLLHQETRDAGIRFLLLSARRVQEQRDNAVYFDGTLQDVTTRRHQELDREALIEKLQTSLLFLHEPISRLGREVVTCCLQTTASQAARMMTSRKATAILVEGEGGVTLGIVTDQDLRTRLLAGEVNPGAPVHTIMSAPVIRISEDAQVYEALMRMEENGIRHLAVEDRSSRVVSVVDSQSLIQFQHYGAIVLAREIARSTSVEGVALCSRRTPPLVKALVDSGARPRQVTRMLASICDSVTERLILLAMEEAGPAPAPFAFVGMGSQGRQEQTLVTDQDNGIIFAPEVGTDPAEAQAYFLRLGEKVCSGLDQAGYLHCRGGVMASNPRWCRPLSGWMDTFRTWITKSESQEIIDLGIFFDLRTIYGETSLTQELRSFIHAALAQEPAIFHHLATNALTFKPPFRLLGSVYLGGGAVDHAGEVNLKDAMMPLVSFARLYALRHRIEPTHTLERIEAMGERNLIPVSSRDDITAAYDFLMQIRLQSQANALQVGNNPANIIQPGKLGYIQQESLKQAFAQIAAVQKKVSYDFLGGT